MLKGYKRADVSPERDRELDLLSWQLLIQLAHMDIAEVLVVTDKCTAVLTRWAEKGGSLKELSSNVTPLRAVPKAACAADPDQHVLAAEAP